MIDAVNEDIMTKHFNNDHSISPAENEEVDETTNNYAGIKITISDNLINEVTNDITNETDPVKLLHRSISDFDLNQFQL
jgi:hypothetical protein